MVGARDREWNIFDIRSLNGVDRLNGPEMSRSEEIHKVFDRAYARLISLAYVGSRWTP